ncbi:MAG TPA: YfiR family protein [Candidatus Limnocylindria bacterium]|nr:YfiR family protein [Candidatus Limnocylindria bacterium]
MTRKFNNDDFACEDSPAAQPGFVNLSVRVAATGNFRQRVFWAVFVFAYFVLTAPAVAQVSKEYQLKAVFLWRLAQFTQWPSDVFETSDSPIVICVLGDNPFDGALNAAVAGETAHGRKFVVQNHRAVEQLKTCHILYMAAAGPRQAKEITAALARKSVLTVRESDIASSYQTIVQFLTEQNKIRLQINLKAAAAARLVLDPRLLRSAEIIETE